MKNQLKRIPLIRILVPFILGIALEAEFRWPIEKALAIILSGLLLSWLIGYFHPKIQKYKFRYWSGIVLFFIPITMGLLYASLRFENHYPSHFSNRQKADFYLIKIDSPILEKANTYKTQGQVVATRDSIHWNSTTGQLLVYLKKDSTVNTLEIGDEIIVHSQPQLITSPKNPGEFDYKKYLNNNQIYHQIYLQPNHWKKTSTEKPWNIYNFANQIREHLLAKLKKHQVTGEEYAVIAALVFGNKDALDKDLFKSYASAGAMHVLAVSGLHVGLVYLIFNSLLFFLNRNKTTKRIKSLLLLIFLWAYALLTGMSPSVLRAVTMLSFIIIGQSMLRKTNVYNTIAASAFALLLVNPFIINKVGFQLSYLAVIGIIYLQPKIYNLVFINNKFLDKLWALTAVSLAAQIATFPLGLLYFHQFPTYFLLSNLFVIPAATVILYLTFIFMVFSWLEVIASFISWILAWFTKALNYTVSMMENLPYNQVQGVVITVPEVYIIYGIIVFITLTFTKQKKQYLYLALFLILVITTLGIDKKVSQLHQSELLFVSVSGESGLLVTQGDTAHFIGTANFFQSEDKVTFHLQNHLNSLNRPQLIFHDIDSLTKFKGQFLLIEGNFIQVFDRKIYIINEYQKENSSEIIVDYYWIRNNKYSQYVKIEDQMQVKTVVIDGTNNYYTTKKIKAENEEKVEIINLKEGHYRFQPGIN